MDKALTLEHHLNGDFSKRVVLRGAAMAWQPSPSSTVWRKRFECIGDDPEKAQVTSIVRYDASSAFAVHDHPDGEEILVLDGIFSDEHGDYPAGTYLLNPTGFRHAPRSKPGCTLFVKLRQYGGDRPRIAIDTTSAVWSPQTATAINVLSLYRSPKYKEFIRLLKFAPGADLPALNNGAEIFVLDGALSDESGDYETGDWMRTPPGGHRALHSRFGATIYLKTGHLPR